MPSTKSKTKSSARATLLKNQEDKAVGYKIQALAFNMNRWCRPIVSLARRSSNPWSLASLSVSQSLSTSTSPFTFTTQKVSSSLSSVRFHYSYSGPGTFDFDLRQQQQESLWASRDFVNDRGFTIGIGGPVGSGKTALVYTLCRLLALELQINPSTIATKSKIPKYQLGVVTNDIFTHEDAEFLKKHHALPEDRIRAVETGGCPHSAIREDVSANLLALEELTRHINATTTSNSDGDNPTAPLLLCESGGDNLAANFSNELADLTLYVIDVAGGDKVPRKGGPGITQSDLLVINKIDLAEAVRADLQVMKDDADRMRKSKSRQGKFPTNDEEPTAAASSTHDHSHQHSHQHSHDHETCTMDHSHTHDHSHSHAHLHDPLVGPTILTSVMQGVGVMDIKDFILENYHRALEVSAKAKH